jgi:hypothetical protein
VLDLDQQRAQRRVLAPHRLDRGRADLLAQRGQHDLVLVP